ncbi:uncharacterized protein LOC132553874 [Ylistrum balloti]|uniref:uncharacterized protein LOC132553874 n=1 Tax=Ylistrum balloti TaxID=509963 RepID=UPI002905EC6A|nr:uncharacterized protein LOC132553874 [Ylistrum balloti]
MGQGHTRSHHGNESGSDTSSQSLNYSHSKRNSACLMKLFQKLELTADEDHSHPGELSRTTFENAFHGPLDKFGKLLYLQMTQNHGNHSRERITKEQFVKSGKEIIKMFDEAVQLKYYFHLFAAGKDHMNKEDALQMISVAYALTLSASSIPFNKTSKDEQVFSAMVQSMFGINEKLTFEDFKQWTHRHSPHVFWGVHNWVYTIMTGSKMPEEQEVSAPVPLLEKFVEGKYCMCMGMLWALSTVLPSSYTHTDKEEGSEAPSTSNKNPLLTSYMVMMKLARLSKCQSWALLYDSTEHGLSQNRFAHHVMSYQGPTVTLVSFEGRNVYCIAEDRQWREGLQKFGDVDSMLIQLTPVYRVIQSGGPLVQWNEHSRDVKKGIHVGKDSKSLVLSIPSDFDKVEHYHIPCEIHKLEVWGCGSEQARDAQLQQKKWEYKNAEKHQARKLRLDTNWDENPDKQILQWGGINVDHQYSRDGGF